MQNYSGYKPRHTYLHAEPSRTGVTPFDKLRPHFRSSCGGS
jgi:hypothetical protein